MQQILGTGLSGLVGSRIVELFENQYDFQNLDLTSGVDITKPEEIEQKISSSKAKHLIHLAAFTDVSKAWEQRNEGQESLCYKVNVVGTKNIAKACKKHNKFLIHFSTDFIFDGEKTSPYTEEDKPHPIEWYGQTKLWAEEEVKNSGCYYTILRIAFPFKEKQSSKELEPNPKLDLVRKIKNKLEKGEELRMFFDQVITPTFIDDIAKAVDYCIKNNPIGTHHCVGSNPISPYDLASIIAEKFNLDKTLIKKTTIRQANQSGLRSRQIYMGLSNKKLEKAFGIKMKTPKEALETLKNQNI